LTLPPETILSCYPEKAPKPIPTTFRTAPLNKEDHQERHDGCACVDDQLPSIGKAKQRPGYRPDEDNARSKYKGRCPACGLGRFIRHITEDSAQSAALLGGAVLFLRLGFLTDHPLPSFYSKRPKAGDPFEPVATNDARTTIKEG
jgi:hypothetical protein